MTEHSARVDVQPAKISLFMGGVAVVLIAVNIAVVVLRLVTDGDLHGLAALFALNGEQNIPTFFSGCLLVVNAGLFAVVWMLVGQPAEREPVWLALSVLFMFLSFDELFQVHERLMEPIGTMVNVGFLSFAWVLVYGIVVVAVAALFLPTWKRLEETIRWWFAASAVAYLLGAIGFEIVGGTVSDASGQSGGALYATLYTIEESLEMGGLIMLTYALLLIIKGAAPNLHVDFSRPALVGPAGETPGGETPIGIDRPPVEYRRMAARPEPHLTMPAQSNNGSPPKPGPAHQPSPAYKPSSAHGRAPRPQPAMNGAGHATSERITQHSAPRPEWPPAPERRSVAQPPVARQPLTPATLHQPPVPQRARTPERPADQRLAVPGGGHWQPLDEAPPPFTPPPTSSVSPAPLPPELPPTPTTPSLPPLVPAPEMSDQSQATRQPSEPPPVGRRVR